MLGRTVSPRVRGHLATLFATVSTVGVLGLAASRMLGPGLEAGFPEGSEPRAIAEWQRFAEAGIAVGTGDGFPRVIVFSDYLCPHCEAAAVEVERFTSEPLSGTRVVWRHFPVVHQASRRAAIASECANRVGVFPAIHALLFANAELGRNDGWDAMWAAVKADYEGDVSTIEACAEADESVARAVDRDLADGQELGIVGVPALLVDGTLFHGALSLERLNQMVGR
jgi:protein-disulfide isomerase